MGNLRVGYDLACQPHSVGDMLVYQQTSLVLASAGKVDFMLVHDPKRQVVQKWMMGVARVNPQLGEAGVMTHEQLNAGGAYWPQGKTHYMFYECMEILRLHYEKTGIIPALKTQPEIESWAKAYLAEHGTVTVQIRRNSAHPRRNSDVPVWVKFLKRHAHERFVVVCSANEVDERLRLPNVRVASDDGADAEKICALVEAAAYHMGTASGPVTMRLCSGKPYVVFRDTISPKRVPALRIEGDGLAYVWSKPGQATLPFDETVERIEREFERMKNALSGAGTVWTLGAGYFANAESKGGYACYG